MTAATIAKEAGFELTAEELLALQAEATEATEDVELSLDELSAVSGGVYQPSGHGGLGKATSSSASSANNAIYQALNKAKQNK